MTADIRQTYPRCTNCEHTWHGLPCNVAITNYIGGTRAANGRCGCPSPFDDDFWNQGTQ